MTPLPSPPPVVNDLECLVCINLSDRTHVIPGGRLQYLVSSCNKLRLESRDEELRLLRQVDDQLSNRSSILCIKSIVELVHNVERRCFDLQDGEEQGRCNHCLLAT